jgi:hypothetical protein
MAGGDGTKIYYPDGQHSHQLVDVVQKVNPAQPLKSNRVLKGIRVVQKVNPAQPLKSNRVLKGIRVDGVVGPETRSAGSVPKGDPVVLDVAKPFDVVATEKVEPQNVSRFQPLEILKIGEGYDVYDKQAVNYQRAFFKKYALLGDKTVGDVLDRQGPNAVSWNMKKQFLLNLERMRASGNSARSLLTAETVGIIEDINRKTILKTAIDSSERLSSLSKTCNDFASAAMSGSRNTSSRVIKCKKIDLAKVAIQVATENSIVDTAVESANSIRAYNTFNVSKTWKGLKDTLFAGETQEDKAFLENSLLNKTNEEEKELTWAERMINYLFKLKNH